MIDVKLTGAGDPMEFDVLVRDGKGETHHIVTLTRATARRLAPESSPEQCVAAAFRFLLDRESKEQILRRFDLSVISRYFPEFERKLPDYLQQPRS
jgi:hypothetical protein